MSTSYPPTPTNQELISKIANNNNRLIGSLNYQIAILNGHAGNKKLKAKDLRFCMNMVANSLDRISKEHGIYQES